MRHDEDAASVIGHHLAVLNLFRERDGTVEITVAMADGAMIEHNALNIGGKPIDYVEGLVIRAADRMAERRKTPIARDVLDDIANDTRT